MVFASLHFSGPDDGRESCWRILGSRAKRRERYSYQPKAGSKGHCHDPGSLNETNTSFEITICWNGEVQVCNAWTPYIPKGCVQGRQSRRSRSASDGELGRGARTFLGGSLPRACQVACLLTLNELEKHQEFMSLKKKKKMKNWDLCPKKVWWTIW